MAKSYIIATSEEEFSKFKQNGCVGKNNVITMYKFEDVVLAIFWFFRFHQDNELHALFEVINYPIGMETQNEYYDDRVGIHLIHFRLSYIPSTSLNLIKVTGEGVESYQFR